MENVKRIFKGREFFVFLAMVLIFLLVGIVNPTFLDIKNILLTLNSSVVYAIIAVGISFVIITGEIDVSIGATLGISATIAGSMIRDGYSWMLALLVAVLIGVIIGIINCVGVIYLKIPSIIMTLGTNGIVRGMCYVFTGGKWVENIPFEYKALSQAGIGNVTYFYIITVAIAIGVHLILTKTKKGRYFAAVGDNADGAILIGIPVKKTKAIAFILCAIFASVGGMIYISRTGFVTPTVGNGYEMKAIAACVLGGISLTGGVGTVIGSVFGAVIMASIPRILVFLQFSSDYDNMITGLLLITIVVLDALLQNRSAENARKQRLSARINL